MKSIALQAELFEGVVSLERGDGWVKPWRLPCDRLALFPPEGALVDRAACPAGVRLRLRTNSPIIAVKVLPAETDRRFDLVIENDLVQTTTVAAGEELAEFTDLPAAERVVECWLPQSAPVAVTELLVDPDAEAEPAPDQRPKWTTYGSSISHCVSAHSPARTWPGVVARAQNVNLTCLGYGGNCHLETMVGRMIRDLPSDYISLKLGINVYGANSLGPRTFGAAAVGLVQLIREKQPEVPIALVSPIISSPRESVPSAAGISLEDMRETLIDVVCRLKSCGDEKVKYFDGLELFGTDLVEAYQPDNCHPNGDGYEIMGRNFSAAVAPWLFNGGPTT